MENKYLNPNSGNSNKLVDLDSPKAEDEDKEEEEEEEEEDEEEEEEEDGELNSLLSPGRRGGISKRPKKTTRKVQWNDRAGDKLVEILEFIPSDTSDSDDDYMDSCICSIM